MNKEELLDILIDCLKDSIKLLPFLFIAFLILEFIEHKMSKKNKKLLTKNKKYGPIVGSILGAFPQCGFSSLATNLFSSRVITMGTLIAVYLSTSDEMLPILISENVSIKFIITIIGLKVLIGFAFGLIIDAFFYKSKSVDIDLEIKDICKEEDCHCEKGIIHSSIHHTIHIALFIFLASLVISILINYIGEDRISNILNNGNYFTYFIASLIGLIPNCASSVIITELYVNNVISIGTMLSGLLTGSGVGILILYRTNKNLKQNIIITVIIYLIGSFMGLLFDLIGFTL